MAPWNWKKVVARLSIAAFCSPWSAQALSAGRLPPPPVCAASGGTPVMLSEPLSFCGNEGLSCCDAVVDASLEDEFRSMNTTGSDASCAKATLCAKCDPFISASPTNAPPPCASTLPSSASHAAATDPVCLERIAAGSFVNMVAHRDGSNRLFLSTPEGTIWLASFHGSPQGGRTLSLDANGAAPFLDLTDRVLHDSVSVLGLKGVAFHPEFATNGRFFVSYYCDRASPMCGAGICHPEELAAGANGYRPCQYQLVVVEFSAKGGIGSEAGARADSTEVGRLFTMGLPQQPYQQHGGQILFRPSDGYLYLFTGNGGDKAHGQFDFSDNERSFLGKIIRFDVDGMAGAVSEPEIVTMGVGNPRGCSYDFDKPSTLYCAGVDQQQYEQVYLIFDGKLAGNLEKTIVISPGRVVAGGRPSIVGGLVYHGITDPMLNGWYLYMYEFALWITGIEGQAASSGHNASSRITSIMCSRNTPLPCTGDIGGGVLSFGEDNNKDAFIISTDGVYRFVSREFCHGGVPPPQLSLSKQGLALLLSFGGGTSMVITLYLVYTIFFWWWRRLLSITDQLHRSHDQQQLWTWSWRTGYQGRPACNSHGSCYKWSSLTWIGNGEEVATNLVGSLGAVRFIQSHQVPSSRYGGNCVLVCEAKVLFRVMMQS